MNEKMLKILGAIISAFVLLILILFILSSCSKKKAVSYEEVENIMLSAAKDYLKDNEKKFPVIDKDMISISLNTLVNEKYMDSIEDLLKEENACVGNVYVTNNNGYYSYQSYLDCDSAYKTVPLAQKIIEDQLVTEGVGLYKNGSEYVMRGEVTNNYVEFNNKMFRIIKINENGSIRLLELEGLSQIVWDDRYNPDLLYTSGINEYEYNSLNSRIKDSMERYYNDSKVWSEDVLGYIETQNLCVGKRSRYDTSKDGSTECKKTINNKSFSLITINEYLDASLDKNCTNTINNNCRNYNWISKLRKRMWSITADADSTDKAYIVYSIPSLSTANSYADINVVINITPSVKYVSGDGSIDNPYVFK